MTAKRSLPRELLTDEESDRLLEQCDSSPTGLRNRTLLLLLEGTGCRIAEVLALEPRDLDWDTRRANVRHGKGNKQRVVPVATKALRMTKRWLRARQKAGIRTDAPVCCNRAGGHLSTSYVRKLLPKLAQRAGITKHVHPHCFRHRYTVRLMRAGVALPSISQALGHSSLATTHRYFARLGAGPAIKNVRAALRAIDRGRGAPTAGSLRQHKRDQRRVAR
jgi:site-specific recombinase XerD